MGRPAPKWDRKTKQGSLPLLVIPDTNHCLLTWGYKKTLTLPIQSCSMYCTATLWVKEREPTNARPNSSGCFELFWKMLIFSGVENRRTEKCGGIYATSMVVQKNARMHLFGC